MNQDIRGGVLYQIFKSLGIMPSVASFEQRKMLQKLVFVIQSIGVPLNFSYNWYLAGPYSPELTPIYYDIVTNEEAYEAQTRGKVFTPAIREKIVKLQEVLKDDLENTELLEAMSSILYLRPFRAEDIRTLKPALSDEVWRKAEERLRDLGLI